MERKLRYKLLYSKPSLDLHKMVYTFKDGQKMDSEDYIFLYHEARLDQYYIDMENSFNEECKAALADNAINKMCNGITF